MALIRRRPTRDIIRMNDLMESFFNEPMRSVWPTGTLGTAFTEDIPLDILEQDNALIVKASVPGIKPEDLHVEVEAERLRIWGESREDKERKDEDYYLREHRYGRVERVTTLPYTVDSDKAKADVEGGMLTLRLPKAPGAKHKEIKVQAKP